MLTKFITIIIFTISCMLLITYSEDQENKNEFYKKERKLQNIETKQRPVAWCTDKEYFQFD